MHPQQHQYDPATMADIAAEQEQYVITRAKLVQAGKIPLESCFPKYQQAIRDHISRHKAGGMTPQQFHAKQAAELKKFNQDRATQGFLAQRLTQRDHDCIFTSILGTVDAGLKPAVRPMLRKYGQGQGYAQEWADKVATYKQPKRMRKSLAKNSRHPVIRDLKEEGMFSQTHKAALQNSTYSGLAELLFSGSQSARRLSALEAKDREKDARIAALEKQVSATKNREALEDAGATTTKAKVLALRARGLGRAEIARTLDMKLATVNYHLR